MAAWFNFALYALKTIVSTVFNLDLGLGFSLGDFEIACLVIGMIATALIIKTGSFASVNRDIGHNKSIKNDDSWNVQHNDFLGKYDSARWYEND